MFLLTTVYVIFHTFVYLYRAMLDIANIKSNVCQQLSISHSLFRTIFLPSEVVAVVVLPLEEDSDADELFKALRLIIQNNNKALTRTKNVTEAAIPITTSEEALGLLEDVIEEETNKGSGK